METLPVSRPSPTVQAEVQTSKDIKATPTIAPAVPDQIKEDVRSRQYPVIRGLSVLFAIFAILVVWHLVRRRTH
jgi:hypothetical protein